MTPQSKTAAGFFRSVQSGEEAFDNEKFILEVNNQFNNQEISEEVHWRVQALKEIAALPEMKAVEEGLRNQLSRIFASSTDEKEILEQIKKLTEITNSEGKKIDLRQFTKGERKTLTEMEYRQALGKKIRNTQSQVENLRVFFPEESPQLLKLSKMLEALAAHTKSAVKSIQEVKREEDQIRAGELFQAYESLKERFLRDWLNKFSSLSPQEVEKLDPAEVKRLIGEHQRHQMTQLLKTKIHLSDVDMTEHLGVHDTLECTFSDKQFWKGTSNLIKDSFRGLIMSVIQAFGIVKGRRYVLFQNNDDPDQYLLFGIGVGSFADEAGRMVEMVPYIKPFTRKAGYLLEVRQREIGNPEAYYEQLRHYMLPFFFAFDHMDGFKMNSDLMNFFTSKY